MDLKQVTLERTAYLPDQLILDGALQVAFAGRSNVGKSSLLNKLFNRKALAKVSQTPGKTQSVNYYRVGEKLWFVDLPGYGYARAPKAERDRWQKLMDVFFAKNQALRGLVHLIDIRHEPTDLDVELHEWTLPLVRNHLYVLTKADKVKQNQKAKAIADLAAQLKIARTQIVSFSAETGEGKHLILNWVAAVAA